MRPRRRPCAVLAGILCAFMLAAAARASAAPPRVLATIKPIHALAASVMEGVGVPELLIRGGASPHAYALTPSGAARLAEAEIIVRVGGALESFLTPVLRGLAPTAEVMTLIEAPGLVLRTGHAHKPEEGEKVHANDPRLDPHIWLSPANGRAIVAHLADRFSARDPDNAARYRENAARAIIAIGDAERRIATLTAALRGLPYIVFHDAYGYFEAHFGLEATAIVNESPDRPPGARTIGEIRAIIRDENVLCAFTEPEFAPRTLAALVEGTGTRLGVLDPLGAGMTPGPGLYPALLIGLAEDLRDCLTPRAERRESGDGPSH